MDKTNPQFFCKCPAGIVGDKELTYALQKYLERIILIPDRKKRQKN